MPTISSEITSVDTLQIKPAAEAFVSGNLNAGLIPDNTPPTFDPWEMSQFNWIAAAVCIILGLLFMRRYISVFPYVMGGFFRWKEILNMENNMRLSRERNSVAFISAPICIICISRLNVINADFMTALTPEMKTLSIIGILVAFIAVRWFLGPVVPARRLRGNTARAADGVWGNFCITLSTVLLILMIIHSISNDCARIAESAAIYAIIFLWAIFLLRKYQIIAYDCGQFKSFLYLCAVEILPAAMLVASILYL